MSRAIQRAGSYYKLCSSSGYSTPYSDFSEGNWNVFLSFQNLQLVALQRKCFTASLLESMDGVITLSFNTAGVKGACVSQLFLFRMGTQPR